MIVQEQSLCFALKKSCSRSIVEIEVTEHCLSLIHFSLLFELAITNTIGIYPRKLDIPPSVLFPFQDQPYSSGIQGSEWSDQACQVMGYARPFDRKKHPVQLFTIFITIYYVQMMPFLIKLIVSTDYTVESQESQSEDSALLRLGAARIDSQVSNFFQRPK